jgi:hypothetical protein
VVVKIIFFFSSFFTNTDSMVNFNCRVISCIAVVEESTK